MPERGSPAIEELTDEACWEILAAADSGRLAVASDDGADLFPVTSSRVDRSSSEVRPGRNSSTSRNIPRSRSRSTVSTIGPVGAWS
jgi:hypothetical protein